MTIPETVKTAGRALKLRGTLTPALLAGLLSVVAAMAGIYAAAAATASTLAATFTAEETNRHAHVVEFQVGITRASAERGRALVRCARLPRKERNICNASANANERSAIKGHT